MDEFLMGMFSDDYMRKNCECTKKESVCTPDENPVIAQVVFQAPLKCCDMFEAMTALENGTLFKAFYKPFKGGRCK